MKGADAPPLCWRGNGPFGKVMEFDLEDGTRRILTANRAGDVDYGKMVGVERKILFTRRVNDDTDWGMFLDYVSSQDGRAVALAVKAAGRPPVKRAPPVTIDALLDHIERGVAKGELGLRVALEQAFQLGRSHEGSRRGRRG